MSFLPAFRCLTRSCRDDSDAMSGHHTKNIASKYCSYGEDSSAAAAGKSDDEERGNARSSTMTSEASVAAILAHEIRRVNLNGVVDVIGDSLYPRVTFNSYSWWY